MWLFDSPCVYSHVCLQMSLTRAILDPVLPTKWDSGSFRPSPLPAAGWCFLLPLGEHLGHQKWAWALQRVAQAEGSVPSHTCPPQAPWATDAECWAGRLGGGRLGGSRLGAVGKGEHTGEGQSRGSYTHRRMQDALTVLPVEAGKGPQEMTHGDKSGVLSESAQRRPEVAGRCTPAGPGELASGSGRRAHLQNKGWNPRGVEAGRDHIMEGSKSRAREDSPRPKGLNRIHSSEESVGHHGRHPPHSETHPHPAKSVILWWFSRSAWCWGLCRCLRNGFCFRTLRKCSLIYVNPGRINKVVEGICGEILI